MELAVFLWATGCMFTRGLCTNKRNDHQDFLGEIKDGFAMFFYWPQYLGEFLRSYLKNKKIIDVRKEG